MSTRFENLRCFDLRILEASDGIQSTESSRPLWGLPNDACDHPRSTEAQGGPAVRISLCVCVLPPVEWMIDDSRCHAVFDVTRFCRKS